MVAKVVKKRPRDPVLLDVLGQAQLSLAKRARRSRPFRIWSASRREPHSLIVTLPRHTWPRASRNLPFRRRVRR